MNNDFYLNHMKYPEKMSRRLRNQVLFATFPLLSHQLYGCLQQPAASNTWAFSAAIAGTYCSNLAFTLKARHVVCGPVCGGTIPRMVKLSTDHMHHS